MKPPRMQGSPTNRVIFSTVLGYFSGHGHHVPDINGDEEDGFDEAIVPADFNKEDSSMIIDDVIFTEVSGDLF